MRQEVVQASSSRDSIVPASRCLSSRLGLSVPAYEVGDDFDFRRHVVDTLSVGSRVDYIICDEAQFYTTDQVEQLARVVDELAIDVFAFGIMTDFRTRLFPGFGAPCRARRSSSGPAGRGFVLVRFTCDPQRQDRWWRDDHRG